MRARFLPLTAIVLAGLSGAAPAQNTPAPAPTPAPPSGTQALTQSQIEDAAFEMRVLISAMQSEKVEAPAKDALFQCLFNNAFGKLSEAVAKVGTDNPGKLDKRNPDQVLAVMLTVCGFRPQPTGTTAPATPPAGQPARPTPQGR